MKNIFTIIFIFLFFVILIFLEVKNASAVLIINNGTFSVNTSGLVGYWKLDEGSGNLVYDYSGNGNSGTISNLNNGVYWSNGRFGNALGFNNITSNLAVYVGNNSILNPTNALTLETWVKLNIEQAPVSASFIGKDTQYSLYQDWDAPNRITFHIRNSTGYDTWPSVTGADNVPLNKWLHVVGTYDSSIHSIKIYINGVLLNTCTDCIYGPINSGYYNANIGSQNLNATLDEVRIWNRSLTADEIKELYENRVFYGTQTNFSLSESNTGDSNNYYDFFRNGTVSGIWSFDEGSGNYTFDFSGNNNTGKLTNINNVINATSGWGTSCKYGSSCLNFDGIDDYVEVPNSISLNITKAITLEAWVYPVDWNNSYENAILTKAGDGSWGVWNLHYKNATAGFRFEINNGSIQNVFESAPSRALNTWYYVVGVYNGSHILLYINGTLSNSKPVTGYISTNNAPLRIGKQLWYGSTYSYWNGTIDEVRIYPRALSAEEILCQYANNCSAQGYLNETVTLSGGSYYYIARASGGQNYTSSSLMIPLYVQRPPQWSNQNSNVTITKLGDSVLFSANWKGYDNDLSYAILETNESGYWANVSAYNSPLAMSGSSYWSNFTWQNNNIKTAKTIAWRIYANDSANNWNVTDTMTFTIDPSVLMGIESGMMSPEGKIISRPNSNVLVQGKSFYSADNSAYANEKLNFYYNDKSLGYNNTDDSGYYWFTFSIPYYGNYNFTVRAVDSYNNTGENLTYLTISVQPLKVRFNLAYHLGASKANNNFTVYENSIVDDWSNVKNTNEKYLCSNYDNQLISLISSGNGNNFYSSILNQSYSSNDYLLSLTNSIDNSELLLAFASGNCQEIENYMYLVEKQNVPPSDFSSFSSPLQQGTTLLIQFKNDKIQINGSDGFSGNQKICIENLGTSLGNKRTIGVRIC